MKKTITILVSLALISFNINSQTFSDDFESYAVGAYLAQSSPNWTTWSGATGGNEDVQIVSNDYHSGSKSIYFSSTSSGGGPQDVVLPFGGSYNTGQFVYEMWIKVESGKGGYFNFQANTTPGQLWAMECYLIHTGDLFLSNTDGLMLQTTFTSNTWFKMTFNINLNTNEWEFLIDGISKGKFSNTVNQIASLDLFPVNSTNNGGNNQAGFWVDDVSYNYTPYTLQPRNGAVIAIAEKLKVAGQTIHPSTRIRNLGTQTITSFDLKVDYNGSQTTESITGVSIPSLGTYDYKFNGDVTAISGSNPLSITISNVNGTTADDDPADDSKIITIDPITPAPGKLVIGEEGTGTWCGWCPRGTVAMAEMKEYYDGFFKGIAVHNGDPMTNTVYDAGMGPLVSGYPSALVDRGSEIDPSEFEIDFLQRVTVPPSAMLDIDADYNSTTKILDVDIEYKFTQSVSGNWKAACVIVEDSVHGTGSNWAQSNYYSSTANNIPLVGAGIDWQAAANPVPASLMWYNDVARAIEPGFTGKPNSFPSSINAGDSHTVSFSINIDPTWNTDLIEIVGILFDNSGLIDNGAVEDFPEENTGISATGKGIQKWQISPNPAVDKVMVSLQLEEPAVVDIMLTDMLGRNVLTGTNDLSVGRHNVAIGLHGIDQGIYFITLSIDGVNSTKRIVVGQ